MVQPGIIFLGRCAKFGIFLQFQFLQFQSASECDTGIEELVQPGSICLGKCVEIGIVLQSEPAAERDNLLAKLV